MQKCANKEHSRAIAWIISCNSDAFKYSNDDKLPYHVLCGRIVPEICIIFPAMFEFSPSNEEIFPHGKKLGYFLGIMHILLLMLPLILASY